MSVEPSYMMLVPFPKFLDDQMQGALGSVIGGQGRSYEEGERTVRKKLEGIIDFGGHCPGRLRARKRCEWFKQNKGEFETNWGVYLNLFPAVTMSAV